MSHATTARIDAFTDAAFAFSVTLLVVGAGGTQVDGAMLFGAIAAIPSFLIGFAIIVMFWLAHLNWRSLRGDGDWRSTLLTLVLIFVMLIYVVPLRAMAASFAGFLSGRPQSFSGGIGTLFAIYGLGFSAMSVVTALLFRDALRNDTLDATGRASALGQVWIWSINAWTGAISTILALIPATRAIAPFAYMTLPVTIPLFAWQWNWGGSVADGGRGTGDPAREPVFAPDDVEAAGDDQGRAEPGRRPRQHGEQQPAVERRPDQP
jgi:uncharacterized membrane protein